MKKIIRAASREEYESNDWNIGNDGGIEDADDIYDVDDYIEDEDWDEVFDWAVEHHESTSPEIICKVRECYEKCIMQNMPEAALNLGTMYYTGRGVEQDYSKAFELYKLAADACSLRTICNLGYCYYYGRGRPVDYENAYYYYMLGATLYDDANCLYKLGDMYENGYYVEKNEKYACMLYKRALAQADESDVDCIGDIQFRLGKCWLRGIGTARIVEFAYPYLRSALENFYKRRKTDPFVGGLIKSAKEAIAEAEKELDSDILNK